MKKTKKHYLFDVLVLDAETRQALVSIRSLGKKGLQVAAIGNQKKHIPAFASRWCQLGVHAAAAEGTEAYFEFLIKFLQASPCRVVIPNSDGTIALLSTHRRQLSKLTTVALTNQTALHRAVNKHKTLNIAKKLGIAIPRTMDVTTNQQLKKALQTLHFPLVIKPTESWVANKTGRKRIAPVLVTNTQQAVAAYHTINRFGGQALVQEYLTGKREAVSLVMAKKKIVARFAQFALRMQPPMGGTSVLRQSIAVPRDLGSLTEKLVKKIGLDGYAEVEFRRDESGKPYLMEINPRLSASVDIAVRSGIDFPYLLYQWANGEKPAETKTYRIGNWERYLAGDIVSTVEALQANQADRKRIISAFLASCFQPMAYDYLDWRDMRPAMSASNDFLLRNIKRPMNYRLITTMSKQSSALLTQLRQEIPPSSQLMKQTLRRFGQR